MAGTPIKRQQYKMIEEAGGEDYVWAALADGLSLTDIAQEIGVRREWLTRWCNRPERKDRYRMVRRMGAEALVDQGLRIVDSATPETANLAKIQADYRRWLASKSDPENWGQQDSGGGVTINLGKMHLEAVKTISANRQRQPQTLEHLEPDSGEGVEDGDWLEADEAQSGSESDDWLS